MNVRDLRTCLNMFNPEAEIKIALTSTKFFSIRFVKCLDVKNIVIYGEIKNIIK